MVSIEEAQRTILSHITSLEAEKVALFQGLNRVTPEDHIAPWDIPAADNSAMDGYAFCHAALRGESLRVIGFLPAGETSSVPVQPGEAIKIMTGALLPPAAIRSSPSKMSRKAANRYGSRRRSRPGQTSASRGRTSGTAM